MADAVDQDGAIAHFTSITGVAPAEARQYLELNSWNLNAAVAEFFTSHDEDARDPDYEAEEEEDDEDDEGDELPPRPAQTSSGGGRRLGDGPSDPQPIPVASSSSSQPKKKPTTSKKLATLGDINAAGNADDDDDPDHKQNLFAGGEKSGLAVQNPDEVKKKIIEKAIQKGNPSKTDDTPRPNYFRGPAQTLGGDEAPSRTVIPATPAAPQRPDRVERVLHFWRDGFSVDDGDLYRTDDPRNADILNGIREGHAPLSIMNVLPGQEVDVEIKQHDEEYTKPKPKYKPFSGSGNRLGSPTPGASSVMPGSFEPTPAATTATTTVSAPPPTADIDPSKPILTLRISLGTGTRLTARFNTTHTIGDVYDFVSRAEPGSSAREYVLQTTFPTKEFRDRGLVLGEIDELKRGGSVVQKYV